nr:uncharacterized mitochondrial protein AtMg00810-like [Tanacetum cinerariifolium]
SRPSSLKSDWSSTESNSYSASKRIFEKVVKQAGKSQPFSPSDSLGFGTRFSALNFMNSSDSVAGIVSRCSSPIMRESTVSLDTYQEASDAADALRKEFEQGCMDQRGATKAGSTSNFNTISNPVNAASTSGTFSAGGPSSPHPDSFPANTLLHVDQNDSQIPNLEDTAKLRSPGIFNSAYDDDLDIFTSPVQSMGAEVDFNNMESSTVVSHIPTYRVHIDHPKDQILGDLKSAVQTRGIEKKCFEAHAFIPDEFHRRAYILFKTAASTPIETRKPLVKDGEAADMDIHLYRSRIGSLMYLTASRLDIMFTVCACSRFQVTPKLSYLHVVKRIFRYLKGQPKLGLWYPRDSSFDLEAYSDSDYARANLDRKSTTGGCQFLGRRLISWQCKKQIIVATSTTEAEYVTAANCYGHVLWIQNDLDFAPQHNMIAYLEKTENNVEFLQIVDFLKLSSIHHSLTVFNNMIRKSEEFSRTVTPLFVQPINESQIPDSEGSGNPPESQPTPSHAQPINESQIPESSSSPQNTQSLRINLKGTGFPHTRGPNFPDPSVDVEVVHKEVVTETLNEPTPQGDGLGSGPGRQETIRGTMAQIRSEGALLQSIDPPLLTEGHTPESDEGSMTLKELMNLCTTLLQKVLDLENVKTAQAKDIASLKKRVTKLEQKQSSRISGFHPFRAGTSKRHSLGRRKVSKHGRKNLKSQQMFQDIDDVLDEDADTEMIVKVKGNGEKRGSTAETYSIVKSDISATRLEVSTAEPKTPPTTTTLFDNEDVTIADTLVKMKNRKAKDKGIAFKDANNSARPIISITTLQPLLTIDLKDKGKGILQEPDHVKKTKKKDQDQIEKDAEIDIDHELAVRLTHEEQEKYIVEERSKLLAEFFERKKKQLAKERAEAIRSKPPIKTQLRNLMMTYLKHTEDEKRIRSRKKRAACSSLKHKLPKKQKVNDQESKDNDKEHKKCLKVVLDDDKAIDYETLDVKSLIVDCESQVLGTNEAGDVHVYKLTRLDGSYRRFLTFSRMLKVLDRQDVLDLHKIIMERFPANDLEGYDFILWGDLKTLVKSSEDDEM